MYFLGIKLKKYAEFGIIYGGKQWVELRVQTLVGLS